ncbi:MAG TPA: AzlD domain-containing protein [Acidimicrobiales bacterium]|nr:AzlD domain-containing protein [Acidimicrobiales bacterium]
MTLAAVLGLAVVTVACKGLGPALRRVPEWVTDWTRGLAPFLLAALVTSEVGEDGTVAVAVGAAAGPVALGGPALVSVAVGAAVAAALRAW